MKTDRFSKLCASLRFPEDCKDGLFNVPPIDEAADLLKTGGYAHVLYAVDHRTPRGKTRTAILLPPDRLECFKDDESFEKRTNELYDRGCYWIGALHA